MKIGIDIHTISGMPQGSKTYIQNLLRELAKVDADNEYYLYSTEKISSSYGKKFFHRIIKPKSSIIRIPLSFPLSLKRDSIDIFHCLYIAPPLCPCKYVVTIQDILFESYPDLFPAKQRVIFSKLVHLTAKRAEHILTCSEYSKNDIYKRYNIPLDKITVTHHGVDKIFAKIDDKNRLNDFRIQHKLPHKFILFVGRIEPRKNIPILIDAYADLLKQNKIKHDLVIVGPKDFGYKKTFEKVKQYGIEKKVLFTGPIENKNLPYIYNMADLFVYPSIAEGFGIPPLEAMACGTPVVTSNTTSLPEVVGNGAITVNPFDIKSLSNAIITLINNGDIRNKYIKSGFERAKLFSWEKSAKKTLKIYERVYRKLGLS